MTLTAVAQCIRSLCSRSLELLRQFQKCLVVDTRPSKPTYSAVPLSRKRARQEPTDSTPVDLRQRTRRPAAAMAETTIIIRNRREAYVARMWADSSTDYKIE